MSYLVALITTYTPSPLTTTSEPTYIHQAMQYPLRSEVFKLS